MFRQCSWCSFALDAGESKDVLGFHVPCLQGSHKTWAEKHFAGPALKCLWGFCTRGYEPEVLPMLWWQHVLVSGYFSNKNFLSLFEISVGLHMVRLVLRDPLVLLHHWSVFPSWGQLLAGKAGVSSHLSTGSTNWSHSWAIHRLKPVEKFGVFISKKLSASWDFSFCKWKLRFCSKLWILVASTQT